MNPMIALFQTPNNNYFFDANKDEMISISYESYQYLNDIQKGNDISKAEVPGELSELMEKGYLKSESVVKEIRHVYTDYLKIFLERKVPKITLQVTQDCNLRCKYCIYSEEHSQGQRSHSTKTMSWESAKRAIDFLREHSVDSPNVNVGLYGGEPLLEFDLVKKIVEYSKECFEGKELTFNMTTNGTLLTDEMILYLEKQEVTLMISLDGPKEINDRNRVFADGSGSFDKVAEGISRIKEIAPNYAGRLHISMVIDPENDFDCINEICLSGSEIQNLFISPNMVEQEYGDRNLQFSSDYIWKMEYQSFLAMLSNYVRYPEKNVSPIANRGVLQAIDESTKCCNGAALREIDVPSGPCIPGQMRLFINVDGLFFPCERVSEKSPAMCIGSLDNGFNLENAKNVLNIGLLTKEECVKCWCFRHCSLCAKMAEDEHGQLSAEAKLSNCEESKNRAYQKMEQYLLFKEIPRYYPQQVSKNEEDLR